MFREDSDAEEEVAHQGRPNSAGADIKRVNRSVAQKNVAAETKMTKASSDALDVDPTVFEYDEVYDNLKSVETTVSHRLSQPLPQEQVRTRSISYVHKSLPLESYINYFTGHGRHTQY